ncbi:MAG TPA: SpoIIE family protein phosphatase [Actinomycetota bacterium]|nr:SpoIIE family protein phosphatase [Actinomycetota bacterium]
MVTHATEVERARIGELERIVESLREDSELGNALLGLSGALAEVRSLEQTIDLAVRMVRELMGADRCFSAAWIAGRQCFEVTGHLGFEGDALDQLLELAERDDGLPLLRTALAQRSPLLIGDTSSDASAPLNDARLMGARAYAALPLIRWGEEFGGIGVLFDSPREFTPKDEALARGISRQVGAALANARQFNLLQTLRLFGERVGSKLTLQEVVHEIVSGARELLSAEDAWVYFLDATSGSLVAAGYSEPPIPALSRIDLTSELWNGLVQGRAVPITNLEELIDTPTGSASAVVAPIPGSEGTPLGGVFVLFQGGLSLGADDMEALSVLAAQSALAIENAQRFERQRRVARSLQDGLLTTEMPNLGECTVGAVYEAAGGEADVGGDFFDVFELPDHRYAIVVGDVSGKGAEAAAQTAMAKYMLRAFATRNPSPSSALFHLNNALYKNFPDDKFMTINYAVFDPATNHFTMGSGGHPAPLVYRYAQRSVEAIEVSGGVLGAFEDQSFEQESFDIAEGDVFVAYTDGLVEARSGPKLYGRWRVEKSLAHHASTMSVEDLARRLYDDAREFGEVTDDTIVFTLGCRVTPK